MSSNNSQRAVAWWLFACCAMVFVTMVVGGVTRLTHSGLSIVEWKPLIGALPPLSHADWLELFAKYQQTPEFIKRNHDMTLDGFQFIFWWEWAHRLSGRLIGVVFFVPYVWFLLRGKLRGALAAKVFGFFILGGLQGAMGWYMVKSGLVDDPRVSQYRLAAHLGLAFLLFGLMFWTGLGMLQARQAKVGAGDTARTTRRLGNGLVALVFIMVLSGALVAGIHAGLAYNTFPLMNGQFRAARDPDGRAAVAQFLHQHGDGAVRPPHDRVAADGPDSVVLLAHLERNARGAARRRAAHALAGGAGQPRHRHAAAAGAGGACRDAPGRGDGAVRAGAVGESRHSPRLIHS
jgi:heme A synthase